jgi:hypothetical protein
MANLRTIEARRPCLTKYRRIPIIVEPTVEIWRSNSQRNCWQLKVKVFLSLRPYAQGKEKGEE